MFLRLASAVTLVFLSVFTAAASPLQSPIVIDENLRVFTMVAALNVAGFDVELGSQYHPARAEVRKIANGLDPDLLQRLKTFYSTHMGGEPDENQLAKYISLAVVLGDPPSLKMTTREEALPDDVRSVLGFVPLLQEFYQKAGISRLWARVGGVYEVEMDRIGPIIRDIVAKTDSYLRAPTAGASSQTMRISVELAAPQNSVNVRSDRDDYYVILGYAANPRVEDIRHAYLHVRLNAYMAAAVPKVANRDSLMELLKGVEGVPRAYSTNFETMLTESFVRAIELRMDRETPTKAQESLKILYRSGLLLAPHFYDSLIAYEATDSSLRNEVATIAGAVNVGKERLRFAETFHSIELPEKQPLRAEVPTPDVVDPVLQVVRAAEDIFERDKNRARELFEAVLKADPNNGRATYGLGLIEMDKANSATADAERDAALDKALQYFERTIASASAGRSAKTWSYIHSGHILDFRCNRTAALAQYRKAIESGDDTRDAQGIAIAQRGLAQPFGGECRQ